MLLASTITPPTITHMPLYFSGFSLRLRNEMLLSTFSRTCFGKGDAQLMVPKTTARSAMIFPVYFALFIMTSSVRRCNEYLICRRSLSIRSRRERTMEKERGFMQSWLHIGLRAVWIIQRIPPFGLFRVHLRFFPESELFRNKKGIAEVYFSERFLAGARHLSRYGKIAPRRLHPGVEMPADDHQKAAAAFVRALRLSPIVEGFLHHLDQ